MIPLRAIRLVILLFLLLAGCRALPPAPPPATVTSPEELLSRLESRQRLRSFQAKGRITFLSPQQNYSGTALLRGILPATLRVDVLDLFGRTILSFHTNGAEVQVLSPREGKLYCGQATPRNLAAFIPPAVSLPQALRLLLGAVPLSPGTPPVFRYDPGQSRYLMEWQEGTAGKVRERLSVAAPGLYPVLEEWFGGGPAPRFTATFADFGSLVPDLPGKLTLQTSSPKIELRLAYTELILNPPLNPGELALTPPAGAAVVPLAP